MKHGLYIKDGCSHHDTGFGLVSILLVIMLLFGPYIEVSVDRHLLSGLLETQVAIRETAVFWSNSTLCLYFSPGSSCLKVMC